jgi:carboxylesterase
LPRSYVSIGTVDAARFYGHERHKSFWLGEGPHRALLLHGFPGTPAELRALGERLAARGFRVYAPLLPGFGTDIPNLGTTRRAAWLAAAQNAWEALHEEPTPAEAQTVLLGFSMGGALALQVAASSFPPRKLVLLAPFWRLRDPRARWLPALQYAVRELRPFENADFSASTVRAQFARLEPSLDLDDPAVQEALRTQVVLPTSALVELQRLGAGAYRAAPRVRAPALVIQGLEDDTVAAEDTRRLALRLGGPVTLFEVPGTHHLISPDSAAFNSLCDRLEAQLLGDRGV